ncbi:uncharacterized protein [Clytia hemisphaerica]|uniref:RING-type domain-containing protein n=1 Tax=Clytia hemisphaerica TaxID=252671 RepID=A0A7M5X379_9CNID
MASSKEVRFASEEQQILGACVVDCPKCTICMTPVTDENNKCQTCLEKMKLSPTGFQFEVDGPDRKMFECPICLCIMRKATELPCEHLMCHDCLFHYEEGQKEKAKRDREGERALFYCSICQTAYDPNKKYHVKSTDRMIQTSLPIKCLQKDCDWVGCIQDYQEHEMKCDFVIIPCPYAEIGCFAKVKRRELQTHMVSEKSTHDILVLKSLSLFSQERVKYQHTIDTQSQQIADLQKTVKQNAKDIETVTKTNIAMKTKIDAQSKAIATNEKKIEVLLKENLALSGRIDAENLRVDEACEQLTKTEINGTITKLIKKDLDSVAKKLDTVEEMVTNDLTSALRQLCDDFQNRAKDLCDLQTFCHRLCSLNNFLAQHRVFDNKFALCTVFKQADLDQNGKELKSCHAVIEELKNENQEECQLLQRLNKIMVLYSDVIYGITWSQRLVRMSEKMQPGEFLGKYIKFYGYTRDRIGVKIYNDVEVFNKATSREKWCKYEYDTACNLSTDEKDLWIALWIPTGLKNICLLNWTEETKKKQLPIDMSVKIESDFLLGGYVILEVEWDPFEESSM